MAVENIHLLAEALNHPAAQSFIATADANAIPHVEENPRLRIDEDGRLEILELDEYSLTNRNLVHSIWFAKKIAVLVRAGEAAVKAVGTPYKAIITGPRFEAHYRALQAQHPDTELSTVWLIDIETVSDERPEVRRARDNAGRLPLTHLDRIAKKSA